MKIDVAFRIKEPYRAIIFFTPTSRWRQDGGVDTFSTKKGTQFMN